MHPPITARDIINQANSRKSTGPRTEAGKQRSAMNAFKHNLSGQHLILVEHEYDAYQSACDCGMAGLKPVTEPERQIAQKKVIDINFRLNRITAIESNMYNLDTITLTTGNHGDDRIEIMASRNRAWKEGAHNFDLLGRYEARLSKQLLACHRELEPIQANRQQEQPAAEVPIAAQPIQTKSLTTPVASFGNFVPAGPPPANPPSQPRPNPPLHPPDPPLRKMNYAPPPDRSPAGPHSPRPLQVCRATPAFHRQAVV